MQLDGVDIHVRWLIAAPIYALAYAVAAVIFWRAARARGWDRDLTVRILGAGLIGGLAGANLVQLLATGLPGKTIEGGIVGGWIAVVLLKRYLGVTQTTGDFFALALPAGEAIGRIGCFIGGCCYGKVAAALPFAVYDHGAFRHPTQLYLSVAAALSFAVLAWLQRRGVLVDRLLYVGGMLFCIDRFVIEFFRDTSTALGPFTLAQLGCMAGFVVLSSMLVRRMNADARTA